MKNIFILLLITFTFSVYSQCPGTKAQNYKTKAQNSGSNTEATGAYVGLATYYAYKCECENGTKRGKQLVNMMNNLVKVNNSYYKNKYGSISKVNSCKSINKNSNDANNSNDISNQTEIKKEETFLQTMSKGLGITDNEVSLLLEGNYEEALKNMRRNQDINNLTEGMSGNSELATVTYDLANTIIENKQKIAREEALKFINLTNSLKINANNIKSFTNLFTYTANFNDTYWSTKQNEYALIENLSNNKIKVSIVKEYNKRLLKKDDNVFLVFENDDLQLKNDFEITFEYGFSSLISSKENKSDENAFSLFISSTNKIMFSPIQSFFVNSFTPSLNMYQTSPINVHGNSNNILGEIFKDIDVDLVLYNDIYNVKNIESVETKRAIEKAEQELENLSPKEQRKYLRKKVKGINKVIEDADKMIEDADKMIEDADIMLKNTAIEADEKMVKVLTEGTEEEKKELSLIIKSQLNTYKEYFPKTYRKFLGKPKKTNPKEINPKEIGLTFYTIKIIKTGLKMTIYINDSYGGLQTTTIDYKYVNKDKIYFGLSNSSDSDNIGYKQKGEFFIIKNFTIKQ